MCLSTPLHFRCSSFQSIVCFCSVVLRTVYTSARRCLSVRAIQYLVCIGSSSRLCRPLQISPIAMSSMFAPAHVSCSHSTPLTLTSSSSTSSPRKAPQATRPINKHCATPPEEDSGPLAKTTSPTEDETVSLPGREQVEQLRRLTP